MAASRAVFYPAEVMNWHDALTAVYQIPCCASAALLIGLTTRAAVEEFFQWFTGAGSEC
jgi:hypothetical protein